MPALIVPPSPLRHIDFPFCLTMQLHRSMTWRGALRPYVCDQRLTQRRADRSFLQRDRPRKLACIEITLVRTTLAAIRGRSQRLYRVVPAELEVNPGGVPRRSLNRRQSKFLEIVALSRRFYFCIRTSLS